jgi:hypothetical protein
LAGEKKPKIGTLRILVNNMFSHPSAGCSVTVAMVINSALWVGRGGARLYSQPLRRSRRRTRIRLSETVRAYLGNSKRQKDWGMTYVVEYLTRKCKAQYHQKKK